MKTIGQIFEFKVAPYTNSRVTPLPCPDPALLYGLELEIEGIQIDPTELYVGGMYGDADNSLRNTPLGRGWEYITKPATFSIVNLILTNFFNKAKFTEENYSERCSVHVHCNVQDMLPEQLKTLCLLYQTFEGVLYHFAGGDRENNIFCVPWAQTQITYKLLDTLEQGNVPLLRNWQKYTGLNLIPITALGTVEFRHLPGTCDKTRILNWMSLIGCMFRTAKSMEFKQIEDLLLNVNTNSEYTKLVQIVFNGWEHLIDTHNCATLIEDGIINVKYLLHANNEGCPQKIKMNPANPIVDYLNSRLVINPVPAPRPGVWAAFDDHQQVVEAVRGEF
jgi:Putative amidoligase enzyme